MGKPCTERAAVSAAFFCLWLSGCASFDTRIPDTWEARVELQEIPFYSQQAHHCGPAALLTVLDASGVSPRYDQVVERVYVPGLEGSLQVELMAAARGFERIPFRLAGELVPVLSEINAGRPVLILQNLRLPGLPAWHYAVVVGYDRERAEILMRSGNEPLQRTPVRRWMRQWDWASRWAIVVLAPGELPVNPNRPAVLRALVDFDDQAPAGSRLLAWQSVAVQWPDESLAWIGKGNARFELGELEGAAEDFAHALVLMPESWPARLNLVQVLLMLDRPGDARRIFNAQPIGCDHPLFDVHARLQDRLVAAGGQLSSLPEAGCR